jgi:hypothetical protein
LDDSSLGEHASAINHETEKPGEHSGPKEQCDEKGDSPAIVTPVPT